MRTIRGMALVGLAMLGTATATAGKTETLKEANCTYVCDVELSDCLDAADGYYPGTYVRDYYDYVDDPTEAECYDAAENCLADCF